MSCGKTQALQVLCCLKQLFSSISSVLSLFCTNVNPNLFRNFPGNFKRKERNKMYCLGGHRSEHWYLSFKFYRRQPSRLSVRDKFTPSAMITREGRGQSDTTCKNKTRITTRVEVRVNESLLSECMFGTAHTGSFR